MSTETVTHRVHEGAASGPAAYGLGCPGGQPIVTNVVCVELCRSPDEGGAALASVVGDAGDGEAVLGQGFFQSTAGVHDSILDPVRFIALWLSLDPPPGP